MGGTSWSGWSNHFQSHRTDPPGPASQHQRESRGCVSGVSSATAPWVAATRYGMPAGRCRNTQQLAYNELIPSRPAPPRLTSPLLSMMRRDAGHCRTAVSNLAYNELSSSRCCSSPRPTPPHITSLRRAAPRHASPRLVSPLLSMLRRVAADYNNRAKGCKHAAKEHPVDRDGVPPSRWRDCHSAAPSSPSSRPFNRDEKGVPAEWQNSCRQLVPPRRECRSASGPLADQTNVSAVGGQPR